MTSPLALEKMLVGCIVVFICILLVGPVATFLQRRSRISESWAWAISILIFTAVALLLEYFKIPQLLAPFVTPLMGLFQIIGFLGITLIMTVCLFTLCGGKGSDLVKFFKRR